MSAGSSFPINLKRFNPVSVTEFANALLQTWQTAGSSYKHGATLGLAVSGGVDSMALAALCSQIQRTSYKSFHIPLRLRCSQDSKCTPLARDIKFQAFVVDHGVRKGSNLEARAVSEILTARNIPTRILKIDWGDCEGPATLRNFESLARKYRFQALGIACRDLGINSMLLAHHEDDQVETLMMRLINGHRMTGLMGIQSSSEIPECFGLHGVHESGGIDNAFGRGSTSSLSASLISSPGPLVMELGGVKVYRPLLQFSKERLIATCQEQRMRWFEDQTNKDPSVTLRNAVRYMYKNHNMPAALSKPALLELSRRSRATRNAALEVANAWLRQCTVKLETRTGLLKARFASLGSCNLSQMEVNGNFAAALLLRRVIMLVTPQEQISLASLVGAVEKVFPELFWTQDEPPPTTAFTVAGLQFKIHDLAKSRPDTQSLDKCEWLISRQPYTSTTALPRLEIAASLHPSINMSWTAWKLYDGRFWMRLRNLTALPMVIRPLNERDMAGFRDSLSPKNRRILRGLLSDLATENIRWTLPALASRGLDEKEKVIALPTLDVGVPGVKRLIEWEVRYKKSSCYS